MNRGIAVAILMLGGAWPIASAAAAAVVADAADAETGTLFAVEIHTGPAWDPELPPLEQAHFRDHGAHLQALREAGVIRMGARWAEIGLLLIVADDEAAVRAHLDTDPSMRAGTFRYRVAPANVFWEWRDAAH